MSKKSFYPILLVASPFILLWLGIVVTIIYKVYESEQAKKDPDYQPPIVDVEYRTDTDYLIEVTNVEYIGILHGAYRKLYKADVITMEIKKQIDDVEDPTIYYQKENNRIYFMSTAPMEVNRNDTLVFENNLERSEIREKSTGQVFDDLIDHIRHFSRKRMENKYMIPIAALEHF